MFEESLKTRASVSNEFRRNFLCRVNNRGLHFGLLLGYVEQSKANTGYDKFKLRYILIINLLLCCYDNNTVQLQHISLPLKYYRVVKNTGNPNANSSFMDIIAITDQQIVNSTVHNVIVILAYSCFHFNNFGLAL